MPVVIVDIYKLESSHETSEFPQTVELSNCEYGLWIQATWVQIPCSGSNSY